MFEFIHFLEGSIRVKFTVLATVWMGMTPWAPMPQAAVEFVHGARNGVVPVHEKVGKTIFTSIAGMSNMIISGMCVGLLLVQEMIVPG